MNRADIPTLQARLEELAEALGGRTIGAKGVLVWLDALSECHIDAVKAALSDWPKRNVKMPTPADILKVCREARSNELEARSRKFASEPGFEAGALRGSSEVAARYAGRIKAILKSPKPHPKQWARDILAGKYPQAGAMAQSLAKSMIEPAKPDLAAEEAREAEFYGLPA
jgi:hypothetical protein